WMAFRDLSKLRHRFGCERHYRNVVPLGGIPKPVSGAVFKPQWRAALMKSHAYAQHAWLVFPFRQQAAAFGLIYCYSPHNCKTIGVQPRRSQGLLITESLPRWRHADSSLHAIGVHDL